MTIDRRIRSRLGSVAIALALGGWGCGGDDHHDTLPDAGAADAQHHATDAHGGAVGDGVTGGDVGGAPASGVAIVGDRRVPFTPNNDLEFIDFFVPHHLMATDMAQMVIDRGAGAEIKAMAAKMKADQTAEIAQMRMARMALTGIAASPPPPADPTQERNMAHMKTLSGAALDRMFVMDMIEHHAGALPAAHRGMAFLKRADMLMLAKQIGDAQAKEVGVLKGVLGALRESDHVVASSPGHNADGGVHGGAGSAVGEDTLLVGDRRVAYTPPSDVAFTEFFIVHHEAAVEMADMVLAQGSSPAVQAIATAMKTSQTREIAEMKSARKALGAPETPAPAPADPLMVAAMMRMHTLTGAALDRMFLEEMIPHHAAALPTAHRALANLARMDMKKLARDMFNAQAEEIGKMHMLLAP